MLGIWVEETDALRPYEKNRMRLTDNLQLSEKEYDCGFLCDIIHPEGGAEVLASYKDDFYADTPCVTRNFFGKGLAYYIGTQPEQRFLEELVSHICNECGLQPLYPSSEGVELCLRVSDKAKTIFAINHNKTEAWVDFGPQKLIGLTDKKPLTGRIIIAPGDVLTAKIETENNA